MQTKTESKYICQLCGKPNYERQFEHRECMDREQAMADDPEAYFGGKWAKAESELDTEARGHYHSSLAGGL
jgi:hypothetical protein